MFSSRKKKTPRAKSEIHVPSPESNSRGFLPNLSTQIAATTVPATYKLKIMSALSTALYIVLPQLRPFQPNFVKDYFCYFL